MRYLKDGTKVAGGFGLNSFVGDSHHDRDIFLEQAVKIDGDGKFTGVREDSKGLWVAASEIAIIEFFQTGGGYEHAERGIAQKDEPQGGTVAGKDDGR
jgi:hypothetical protein